MSLPNAGGARSPVLFRAVTETIGRTPLVELSRLGRGLPARILANWSRETRAAA